MLVTGAAGFVGRSVMARLRGSHEAIGLDVVPGSGVDVCGDLRDAAVLAQAFAGGVDAVIHLATVPGGAAERDPALAWAVNVDGTRALADAAMAASSGARPTRFVFASSIAVFGDPLPALIDDATPCSPRLLYGAHKAMMETWLQARTLRGEVAALSLRLPGILARPRGSAALKSAFISDLFHALAAGESITLPVSPAATIGVMSVPRLAANLQHALEGTATGTMNLPALHVTMADLVAAVAAATDADPEQVSWSPDEALEAQFGRFPPLRADRAAALGFRADDDVAALVDAALAAIGRP